MPASLPSRTNLLLIAALSFAALGVALASQYLFDMPPCAWCVLQRLIYLVVGVLALLGAAIPCRHARRGSLGLIVLLSIAGVVAAWYQHTVAAKMFSCDMTFADRFMSASSLDAAFPFLFGIYATCMDAAVQVLGLEYALWSLILFVVLAIIGLIGLFKRS